jgi:predicted metal-binding membrane protein
VTFMAVWWVMIGAMMLPTTVAMARLFTAVSANQPRPGPGRAAFYATYVLVWSGFAMSALVGDTLIHAAVDRSTWLAAHTELILAGTLMLAGLYQLSPLKDACLRACRSPMSVIGRHYTRGLAGGWRVGRSHALNCLGCCWALMLVMFATGVGSLAWMLGLSAVMLAEKTSRYGAQLVRPVAFSMLAAGLATALLALV